MNIHYHAHILSCVNPVHTLPPSFLMISPNVIQSFNPRSSKWSLSVRFPHQNTKWVCPLLHTCHIHSTAHLILLDLFALTVSGSSTNYKTPHYAAVSILLFLPPSTCERTSLWNLPNSNRLGVYQPRNNNCSSDKYYWPLVSPCSPIIQPWQLDGDRLRRWDIKNLSLDESRFVPEPMTRFFGNPLSFHATYVKISTVTQPQNAYYCWCCYYSHKCFKTF